jgi:ParB/RepB/Spo0J family partition protein
MQETSNNNDKINQFIAANKNYIESQKVTTKGLTVVLKASAVKDADKYREIVLASKDIHAILITSPAVGFLIPLLANTVNDGLLHLHRSDIEFGGPQPRLKISLDDPKTAELCESIRTLKQLDPIEVYHSPANPDKYRVFEGHQRYYVIFDVLNLDTINAVCLDMDEKQAYQSILPLHKFRESYTDYEMGHYIVEVLQRKYPEDYSTQEKIAGKLGVSRPLINLWFTAYIEVNAQKGLVKPENSQRLTQISASKIEPISRQAPEKLKTPLLESSIENDFSRREIKELVNTVKDNPEADAQTVTEEAEKIKAKKTERAQELMKEADKTLAKTERARDKVVAAGEDYPEALMKAVYGHLGLKGKVTPDKAKAFASDIVGVFYQKCFEKQLFVVDAEGQTHLYDLEAVLRDADAWQ